MRVQWPQYCGHVGSISARTLVGYRCVSPSTAHMSASWRLSRCEYGWRRPLGVALAERRAPCSGGPGRARSSRSFIVLIICGGMSIDIVARSNMSRWMSAVRSSVRKSPSAAFSSFRFFTLWARCHWALSHCSRGDVPVAGKARPVGLRPLALQRIPERLLRGVGARLTVARSLLGPWIGACGRTPGRGCPGMAMFCPVRASPSAPADSSCVLISSTPSLRCRRRAPREQLWKGMPP